MKKKTFAGFGANFHLLNADCSGNGLFFFFFYIDMANDCIKNAFCLFQMKHMHVSRRCVFIISITTYTVVYSLKYTKRALCKPGKYLQTPTDT